MLRMIFHKTLGVAALVFAIFALSLLLVSGTAFADTDDAGSNGDTVVASDAGETGVPADSVPIFDPLGLIGSVWLETYITVTNDEDDPEIDGWGNGEVGFVQTQSIYYHRRR